MRGVTLRPMSCSRGTIARRQRIIAWSRAPTITLENVFDFTLLDAREWVWPIYRARFGNIPSFSITRRERVFTAMVRPLMRITPTRKKASEMTALAASVA